MRKVNTNHLEEEIFISPGGKYGSKSKEISIALGRKPASTDLNERHPFDVEICQILPGKSICPYHAHSAQWEFYHVLSGTGVARHEEGSTAIEPGDAFLFGPGEPHQIANNHLEDLIILIVADNPIGETCYYPDSNKWLVRSPVRSLIRSEHLDAFDGEE
jgi:uncharacterized cupin superfamily protein